MVIGDEAAACLAVHCCKWNQSAYDSIYDITHADGLKNNKLWLEQMYF